jgi:hypothetical protein
MPTKERWVSVACRTITERRIKKVPRSIREVSVPLQWRRSRGRIFVMK